MTDSGLHKCSVCGKEVELEGGLHIWATKNPDKFRCEECRAAGKFANGKGGAPATKKSSSAGTAKKAIEAKMFRQAFDELMAEFKDDFDTVSPFMGGWVSTLVINRSK